MPPLSLSARNPSELVVTPSSGSPLLRTTGSAWNGAKRTRTPPTRPPRPLVSNLGDHEFIAKPPAALRSRGHAFEGVLFRKILGAGDQDMVTDLALGIRLPELRVLLQGSPQGRCVLSTQRAVHRHPDRYYGVEEWIVLPKREVHVQGRHRLVERRTNDTPLPIQVLNWWGRSGR